MKSGGPLKRTTPLKQGGGLKTRSPMKRKAPRKREHRTPASGKAFRSRAYLDWVKAQPCVVCGAPADDPHHLAHVGGMSGMGMTAPDSLAMPVCRPDHDRIHREPELWPLQFEWIAKTLDKALRDGVLEEA